MDRTPPQQAELDRAEAPPLPEAAEARPAPDGVALCLSGGGYRAALFHLGALRRLSELGALDRVTAITAVSGGSIIAAHLATRLAQRPAGTVWDWEKEVAGPFRAFAGRDIRTVPILLRYLPWNWFRRTVRVRALADQYEKKLTAIRLREIPESPRFSFCATDMVFGVNWVFERGRIGDYRAGYATPPQDLPLARAVAASSCFPPIFAPLPVGLPAQEFEGGDYHEPDRHELIGRISLTDGGVYDNLGLEPVWPGFGTVLISDGGGRLWFSATRNPLKQLQRYAAVIQNQALAVRKRWFFARVFDDQLRGTYWGVGSAVESYAKKRPDVPHLRGYSKEMATRIARIRTDLDGFTRAEIEILENHGYLLADAAVRCHAAHLVSNAAEPHVPHERWLDEKRAAKALRFSGRHFSLVRLGKTFLGY